MKLKRCVFTLIFVPFLLSLSTLNASACGGFVALRGEKIFHSVYCDKIYDMEYSSLKWFNTARDAEVRGYAMCEECFIFHDEDFRTEYCDYYFQTKDPLLLTAMELSFTYGNDCGFESGRESMLEDLGGSYDAGYEKGYQDGRERGRMEVLEERNRQEEQKKEERSQSIDEILILVCFLGSVAYVLNWLDNRKKK